MWALLACGTPTPPFVPDPDLLLGPEVFHTVPMDALVDGDLLTVFATATDDDGVREMELRHRITGTLLYERVVMQPDGDGFSASISVQAPGVDYVLRAFDDSDWRIPGTFPEDAERDPVHVPVEALSVEAPYHAGFDGDLLYGFYEVGWTDHALEFRGQRWNRSTTFFDGTHSARHGGGFPSMPAVDDWLVSPTLDLTGLLSAEVRWMELGYDTEHAQHSLWISTGSANPEDGDFVPLAHLEPPVEGMWASAPVVDLSPWTTEARVSLAWRYEGEGEGDSWRIDDVRVREFGPDLRLVEAVPTRLDPGGSGLLAVQIRNRGAAIGPVDLCTTLGPCVAVGALDTGQEVHADLVLEIPESTPDNTVISTELTASDGLDTVSWPVDLQVGDTTAGLVRIQVPQSGLVQVWAGVGDPSAPLVEEVVFEGILAAGVHTLSVDLADHLAFLPPEVGRARWFTRVNGEVDTQMLGFGIDFDGSVVWSAATGITQAGEDGVYHLPTRARPVVTAILGHPLAPGQASVLELELDNPGGPTVGLTEARITADAALGLQIDTLPLPADWTGLATLSLPVSVHADHTDSLPLSVHLDIVDAGEVYPVDVSVPVPWPRLLFGAPVVTGDLAPGVQVAVLVPVRNEGMLETGTLHCALEQIAGPTVAIAGGPLQVIQPGTERALNLLVDAVGTSDGDTLQYTVTCADDIGSWSDTLTLPVGGEPWIPIGMDPSGDAQPGADFDVISARFRVDHGVIELEITSVDPVPSDVTFELWTDSPGSDWREVVLTVLDGEASLWGTQSGGWNALAAPTVTTSGRTLTIGLPEAHIGLAENTLQVALGTGFCGTDALFCEHWPDDWGNPYHTAVPSEHWIQLTW